MEVFHKNQVFRLFREGTTHCTSIIEKLIANSMFKLRMVFLDSFVVIKQMYVFLCPIERLNFSWIQKCNSSSEAYIRDLPKMDHSQLLQYLRGEFPVSYIMSNLFVYQTPHSMDLL